MTMFCILDEDEVFSLFQGCLTLGTLVESIQWALVHPGTLVSCVTQQSMFPCEAGQKTNKMRKKCFQWRPAATDIKDTCEQHCQCIGIIMIMYDTDDQALKGY